MNIKNISIILWLLYSYSFLALFINFMFFWLPFELNILPLISIMDIFLFSLVPIISLIPIVAVYYMLANVGILVDKENTNTNPPSGMSKVIIGLFLVMGGGTAILKSFELSGPLTVLLVFISCLAAYLIYKKIYYINLINAIFKLDISRGLYLLVVILPLLFIILFAYKGVTDSRRIIYHGDGFFLEGTDKCKPGKNEKFVYISTVGSRVVSYSTLDSSICITDERSFRLARRSSESNFFNFPARHTD